VSEDQGVLTGATKIALMAVVAVAGFLVLTEYLRSAGTVISMALGGAWAVAIISIYKYPKFPWQ
jgi:hypothetical protein